MTPRRALTVVLWLALSACGGRVTGDAVEVRVIGGDARCGEAEAGVAWLDRAAGRLRVSLGERPTTGYALRLGESPLSSTDAGLVVTVVALTPADDAMVAQVLTRPCLDLELTPSPSRRVIIEAMDGNRLGVLEP